MLIYVFYKEWHLGSSTQRDQGVGHQGTIFLLPTQSDKVWYKAVKFGMVTNSRRFYGDWLSRPPTGLCWEHLAVVERMHSPECSSSYYLFMNSDTLILLPVAEVYEVIVFMLIISEKLCYCWFYFCHALVLTYLYGKLNFRLIGWSLLLI